MASERYHNGKRPHCGHEERTTSHHVAPRRTLCLSARAWPLLLAEDQSNEKMEKKRRKVHDLSHCLSLNKRKMKMDEQRFKLVGHFGSLLQVVYCRLTLLPLLHIFCISLEYLLHISWYLLHISCISLATTRSSNLKKSYLLDTCLTLATCDLLL